MHDITIPKQVKISEIQKNKFCLSPGNYETASIYRKLQAKLSLFLQERVPYVKGDEPGSSVYVHKPGIRFIRNSCIDSVNYSHVREKEIYIKPSYTSKKTLANHDVLLCKDANIGDSCLYIEDRDAFSLFSSGIVRLNFLDDQYKYYCLAFLKDSYFLKQLDFKAPRGSTLRHAGDSFLDCYIPQLRQEEEWLLDIFENLIKNIAYSENYCRKKMKSVVDLIDNEIQHMSTSYENPTIKNLLSESRVDAGVYTKEVHDFFESIVHYRHGYSNVESFGFDIKRGPNLAKRDLGRSIQTDEYKPGYNLLIYPSDISDSGYLLRTSYIGARNRVWFLESKNILFSTEGTVGKTFIVCDEVLKFTTNFHGTIIYPKDEQIAITNSVFLGLFLYYLRAKGIFDKLSVGGQGGSFAVGYWSKIIIPNFPIDIKLLLSILYHNKIHLEPTIFDEDRLLEAGVFELNNFRIVCTEMLRKITEDIKIDALQSKQHYTSSFASIIK